MVKPVSPSPASLWSLPRLNENRLYQLLGIELTTLETDRCVSLMRPPPGACWPEDAQPHGGILYTQLDTTLATAVLSGFAPGTGNCSTVDLTIHYLAPATGPVFTCEAEVTRRGNRVCFVRGETHSADGRVVAHAQGTFRVFATRPAT